MGIKKDKANFSIMTPCLLLGHKKWSLLIFVLNEFLWPWCNLLDHRLWRQERRFYPSSSNFICQPENKSIFNCSEWWQNSFRKHFLRILTQISQQDNSNEIPGSQTPRGLIHPRFYVFYILSSFLFCRVRFLKSEGHRMNEGRNFNELRTDISI